MCTSIKDCHSVPFHCPCVCVSCLLMHVSSFVHVSLSTFGLFPRVPMPFVPTPPQLVRFALSLHRHSLLYMFGHGDKSRLPPINELHECSPSTDSLIAGSITYRRSSAPPKDPKKVRLHIWHGKQRQSGMLRGKSLSKNNPGPSCRTATSS
jgi:hypothetical protein